MTPKLVEVFLLESPFQISGKWPEGSMFRDPPKPEDIPMANVKSGTSLFHGTHSEEEWDVPNEMTWFAFTERAAALYEPEKDGRFRVMEFTVVRDIKAIYHPGIKKSHYDREDDHANYWLKQMTGISFSQIGYARVPEAFAVVERYADGLFIEKEDGGHPAIMICRPDDFVKVRKK